MGDQIENEIIQNLFSSPSYSIIIDETTNAATSILVIYIIYLTSQARVYMYTSFLAIAELPDGKTVEKHLSYNLL